MKRRNPLSEFDGNYLDLKRFLKTLL